MGDLATSAAYYVSVHADRIYANPDTFTAGVGVIWTFSDISRFNEKEGFNVSTVKSGSKKDMGSTARPITDEEQAYAQKIVNDSFENFISDVTSRRAIARSEIDDGRVIRGADAIRLNIVDEIGNLNDAINGAKKIAESAVLNHMDGVCLHELTADRRRVCPGGSENFNRTFSSTTEYPISVRSATARHAPSNFVRSNAEARSKSFPVIPYSARRDNVACSPSPEFNRPFARHEKCDAAPSAPDVEGNGTAVCSGNGIRAPVGKYETVTDQWFSERRAVVQTRLSAQLKRYDWNAETNIERSFGGNSWSAPG